MLVYYALYLLSSFFIRPGLISLSLKSVDHFERSNLVKRTFIGPMAPPLKQVHHVSQGNMVHTISLILHRPKKPFFYLKFCGQMVDKNQASPYRPRPPASRLDSPSPGLR